MSSFISITTQIAPHATFGATWDPEHNQHLVRLGSGVTLFLGTSDARALYASLGASLASRGAVAMPRDIAARLELLSRTLHWEGHEDYAEQVAAILAPAAADTAPAVDELADPAPTEPVPAK
jgi:hypothetical protein